MTSRRLVAAILMSSLCPAMAGWCELHAAGLIRPELALRHGLNSAWVRQVAIDPGRDRLRDVILDDGLILCRSSHGVVQALDAETGRSLWDAQVGNRQEISYAPSANDRFVVVPSGTRLFIINREDGTPHQSIQLGGAPAAQAAITATRVYVPMNSGRIEAYELDDPWDLVWRYRTSGIPEVQPISTGRDLLWGTSRGFVYGNPLDRTDIRFQLETRGPIAASLAFRAPNAYVASVDQEVYAMDARSGALRWRFVTTGPIRQPVVAMEDAVYVCPDRAGMYSLAIDTGDLRWRVDLIKQFVAASATRIYAADEVGRIWALDPETGQRLDALPAQLMPMKMINSQTDRIYLADPRGIVQCLHELALVEPISHQPPVEEVSEGENGEDEAAEDGEPEDGANPAADPDDPDADPFP